MAARAQVPKPQIGTPAAETKSQRDARMRWWREAKFGLFIHWGLYAVPAGTWNGNQIGGIGEWIMNTGKIPVKDYAAFATQFNPTQFNADEWVRTAQAAGMKYVVMTAKHHDGFAMFRSRVDGFNIYDATPFKRDPIAEMAAACRKHGLKFGIYYSQAQDWHHPGGAAYGGHWDPAAQDGDLHRYVRTVAAPQIRELMVYRPAVLWWDTPIDMTPEDIALITAPLASDPGLILNNRLGNGVRGDTETPEQTIPATGFPGRDWETCMTINDTWGYKSSDTNFKSTETLLHNLIDIASKGGNYLLNVGPDATGVIPAPEVQRLRDVGAWMRVNGDAIYGTTHSPFKRLPFEGGATVKGDTLFLHVFHWPATGLSLSGLKTPVREAKVLAGGQELPFRQLADGSLTVSRPVKLDPLATVVALRLAGPPVVELSTLALQPQADGRYILGAEDAEVHGDTAHVETKGKDANIGFWTNAKDSVGWTLAVPAAQAKTYQAEIEYACPTDTAGTTYTVKVDSVTPQTLTGTVQGTGGWEQFQTKKIDGTLTLAAGTATLRVIPQKMPGFAVMNLRRITLTPVATK